MDLLHSHDYRRNKSESAIRDHLSLSRSMLMKQEEDGLYQSVVRVLCTLSPRTRHFYRDRTSGRVLQQAEQEIKKSGKLHLAASLPPVSPTRHTSRPAGFPAGLRGNAYPSSSNKSSH